MIKKLNIIITITVKNISNFKLASYKYNFLNIHRRRRLLKECV